MRDLSGLSRRLSAVVEVEFLFCSTTRKRREESSSEEEDDDEDDEESDVSLSSDDDDTVHGEVDHRLLVKFRGPQTKRQRRVVLTGSTTIGSDESCDLCGNQNFTARSS